MRCANCSQELATYSGDFGPVHEDGLYACDVPADLVCSSRFITAELPDDAVILGSLIDELSAVISRLREIVKETTDAN